MFDDVFGLIERCAETFRGGVRDSFGASINADVLEPITNKIGMLRVFHEDYLRHSLNIGLVLQEARSITYSTGAAR